MNRHIFGLTLFLIIVKIHFLLYWAFFAPINFLSTQPATVASRELVLVKTEGDLKQKPAFELQNVIANFKDSSVSANIKINHNEVDFAERKIRVQFFDENKQFVWASEVETIKLSKTKASLSLFFCSEELSRLNVKKNYYARIYEPGVTSSDYYRVENLQGLKPVLLDSESKGVGCGYSGGCGHRLVAC